MPKRPTHAICGMLSTKDVSGYMAELVGAVSDLHAVAIPGETATLPAEETAEAARSVGLDAVVSGSVGPNPARCDAVATAR